MHASFQPLIGSLAARVCGIAGGLGCATQVVRLARADPCSDGSAPRHLCAIGRTWTLRRTP